jgi:hypothetical protein
MRLHPLLTLAYVAAAAIGAYRIAKFGAADGEAIPAAASTDALIGVTTSLPASLGERVDVIRGGIAEVEFGGNVTRGDWLTADAQGRAITAAPAAGVNANVIGRAECSGVLGDIGSVLIAPGRIQG